MAIFNNMYLTNAGQILYTKAQAGQQINFTKMQVGAGQIGTQNPATLNALINSKFDVAIQSISANTDLKTATISGTVNNTGITEAVYICEIGLFANDPDNGEILYGYASAGTYGDYYAPESSGPYTWNYEINAAIGNAANVTAQLSSLNYDYGVINTDTSFGVISGGNQREINKSIDASLSDMVYQVAGGTATALTLTIKGTLTTGYPITFIASANNSGNATTINGKKLYKPATTNAPTLIAGKAYTVWYNSTGDSGNGCFFIKASATGTATPEQVLANIPFSSEVDTDLVGTIPSKTAQTYKPTITDQVISAGQYLSEPQTIKGYSDLLPENIRRAKQIGDVVGSYAPFLLTAGTANYIYTNDAEYSGNTSLVLTKSATIGSIVESGSVVTVYFGLYTQNASYSAQGQIYVNGVARGTLRTTTSTTAVYFTENITVNPGDVIQIYAKSNGYYFKQPSLRVSCANAYILAS